MTPAQSLSRAIAVDENTPQCVLAAPRVKKKRQKHYAAIPTKQFHEFLSTNRRTSLAARLHG